MIAAASAYSRTPLSPNRRAINKLVPQMDLNVMRRKSATCGGIVEWLKAIHKYLAEKDSMHAYDAEKLYAKKLQLCRQLALIQKKLEYRWSFDESGEQELEDLGEDFEDEALYDEEIYDEDPELNNG